MSVVTLDYLQQCFYEMHWEATESEDSSGLDFRKWNPIAMRQSVLLEAVSELQAREGCVWEAGILFTWVPLNKTTSCSLWAARDPK